MNSNPSIFPNSQLEEVLLQRGEDINTVGLRDLKRYYALLKRSLSNLSFSIDEVIFICNVLKDYKLEEDLNQIEVVLSQIREAAQHNHAEQQSKINTEILISKLEALSHIQTLAIVDAVEQFWIKRNSNPNEVIHETLEQVDLLSCCDFAL